MTSKEITIIANKLITQGNLKLAFEHIASYLSNIEDRSLARECMLLSSNFSRNQRDFDNETISKTDYNVALSRSNNALMSLLDRLPDSDDSEISKISNGVKRIIFLSANPSNSGALSLGRELRKIKDELLKATERDSFIIEEESAVSISTIMRALKSKRPEIVHFSGHGTGEEGIMVEDESGNTMMFTTEGLDRLFRRYKETTKCVVLNACFSQEQAAVISKHGMYVVGMNSSLDNDAAIAFSVGFYQSLGEGESYEEAFEDGLILISSYIHDAQTPELWFNGEKCLP